MRRKGQELKREVLTYYGNGKCACVRCRQQELACLSIDHIDGRKTYCRGGSATGQTLYLWLKNNGYPEGYQTLCMNCQFIKREEVHEHKEMKGRNSVVVSIRVDDSVYTILAEKAEKKGMTVSAFIKVKVEEYARLAQEFNGASKPEEYVVIGGQRFKKSA